MLSIPDEVLPYAVRYFLHSAIFQIVANNFLEVLLRSYWHVAVFVILTKSE